jgi:LPS-assembly protein
MRGLGTSHRQDEQGSVDDVGGRMLDIPAGRPSTRALAGVWVTVGFTLAVCLLLSAPNAAAQVAQPAPLPVAGSIPVGQSSFPRPQGGILGGKVQEIDAKQPLYLQGDELVYDTKGNKVVARGNVEIFYNNYVLRSDEVTYDQAAGTLTAVGNVEVKEPNGNIIRAERYTLTDDFKDGFIQALSAQGQDDTRIAAERAVRRDGNVTEFQNGKFSPCKSDPGKPPLWCISAARIVHDQANGTITYQDGYFELFGQKVLYLPYFQHPDPTIKRRSGFLIPEIGSSKRLGLTSEIPYFFNLAPNYDLTVHPMYTAKQGVLWQGDWRHRVSFGDITGEYNIKLAGIDQKSLDTKIVGSNLPENWRGSIQTKGAFSLSSWWKFGWDVTIESDDGFRRFYNLDNILQTDRVNSVFLQGLGERSHFSVTGYQLGGLLLSDSKISDSRVMPVVDWNYVAANSVFGGELGWNVNAVNFNRSDALSSSTYSTATSKVPLVDSNITRASADINWRRKLTDNIGITYTPFANIRGDVTRITDAPDPSRTTTLTLASASRAPLLDETQTRGVAAAGVLAAYPWIANSANASHIIEPLGQLIGRTSKENQRRTPDEDARSLVLDDTNLFELSKFSGYDRTETGTRANVGLQYTFQANNGGSARVLAGQSFHLSGENAYALPGLDIDGKRTFNPNSGLATTRSDYVLGLYLAPSTIFRAVGQMRFDEATLALRRADVMVQANYGPITATAMYGYTSADPLAVGAAANVNQQQIAANLGLKLTDRWSVLGAVIYDIDEKFRVQDALQVKYTDDCFAISATYAETFINNPSRDITPDRSIMLRFEFKYLGGFGKTSHLDTASVANQAPTR